MREKFYKRLGRPIGDLSLPRRAQDVLYDKKWKIFLRRARLFRHIPFVEFVFAAGSMALGNVGENSDFDVIVGAKHGRIFTARFFSVLTFGALRTRRKKLTHHEHARDKICLNHFVTEKSYALRPPHNIYWEELYKNLVPLYGSDKNLNAFLTAQSWVMPTPILKPDLRYKTGASLIKRVVEKVLSGKMGDSLESRLRAYQLKRIEAGFARHPRRDRIRASDDELEFHPDISRIDKLTQNA